MRKIVRVKKYKVTYKVTQCIHFKVQPLSVATLSSFSWLIPSSLISTCLLVYQFRAQSHISTSLEKSSGSETGHNRLQLLLFMNMKHIVIQSRVLIVVYIVVDVEVFVVMKYIVIQMVFTVETYVRKKSYKKCHSRFLYQFHGVLILFKINVHKSLGFLIGIVKQPVVLKMNW